MSFVASLETMRARHRCLCHPRTSHYRIIAAESDQRDPRIAVGKPPTIGGQVR